MTEGVKQQKVTLNDKWRYGVIKKSNNHDKKGWFEWPQTWMMSLLVQQFSRFSVQCKLKYGFIKFCVFGSFCKVLQVKWPLLRFKLEETCKLWIRIPKRCQMPPGVISVPLDPWVQIVLACEHDLSPTRATLYYGDIYIFLLVTNGRCCFLSLT